jgi:hypothetical protein
VWLGAGHGGYRSAFGRLTVNLVARRGSNVAGAAENAVLVTLAAAETSNAAIND